MATERRALLDHRGGRAIAALLVGGRLQDLLIDAPSAPAVGEIWAARVDKPASRAAGGGAFLILGGGLRAFLPGGDALAPGDACIVEIQRGPEERKAAVASRKLGFAGARMVHTPAAPGVNVSRKIADPTERARLSSALEAHRAAGGFVLRTAAAGVSEAALQAEAQALIAAARAIADAAPRPPRRLRAAPSLAERAAQLWPDAAKETDDAAPIDARPFARHGLEAELGALLQSTVPLSGAGLSGAWMALERTAAVVAIDINAGASRAAQTVNLAALAEIPRQLRLRGWGGQIVVDLAGTDDQAVARKRYAEALARAADGPLTVLGFGPLGLLEARRRRDRAPIETMLAPDAFGAHEENSREGETE